VRHGLACAKGGENGCAETGWAQSIGLPDFGRRSGLIGEVVLVKIDVRHLESSKLNRWFMKSN